MDYTEAKELLLLHSYGHENTDHPKLDAGFLGMLRPYRGLNEDNYHEVMQAIVAVAPHLRHASTIT